MSVLQLSPKVEGIKPPLLFMNFASWNLKRAPGAQSDPIHNVGKLESSVGSWSTVCPKVDVPVLVSLSPESLHRS